MRVKEELTNLYGREPSILEIASKMNTNEFDVSNALNSLKDTISMFEPIYNDGGDIIYLEDQLGSNDGYYDLDTKISLREALNKIKEKEKYILMQRYIMGKTQMELAEEIGISQAQISRLEKSGLAHVKKLIN